MYDIVYILIIPCNVRMNPLKTKTIDFQQSGRSVHVLISCRPTNLPLFQAKPSETTSHAVSHSNEQKKRKRKLGSRTYKAEKATFIDGHMDDSGMTTEQRNDHPIVGKASRSENGTRCLGWACIERMHVRFYTNSSSGIVSERHSRRKLVYE